MTVERSVWCYSDRYGSAAWLALREGLGRIDLAMDGQLRAASAPSHPSSMGIVERLVAGPVTTVPRADDAEEQIATLVDSRAAAIVPGASFKTGFVHRSNQVPMLQTRGVPPLADFS